MRDFSSRTKDTVEDNGFLNCKLHYTEREREKKRKTQREQVRNAERREEVGKNERKKVCVFGRELL